MGKMREINGHRAYVPVAYKKWHFVNGELTKVIKRDTALNQVLLWNDKRQRNQLLLLSEYEKKKRRAYRMRELAKLFEIEFDTFRKRVMEGTYPQPYVMLPKTGAEVNGYWGADGNFRLSGPQRRLFFSEDQIYEIREIRATTNMGRPRQDGMISRKYTWIPSEAELNVILGRGMLLYAQDGEGKMIPVWSEKVWD